MRNHHHRHSSRADNLSLFLLFLHSLSSSSNAKLVVSKAFTVLSDPQKRAIFDQHGPDDGKSTGVNYDRASPMGHGFGGGGRGMNGYEEVSPEELFNMFFGGGSFGGCKLSMS